jgi:glycosyltransferase involved in cell wall biosynthesis
MDVTIALCTRDRVSHLEATLRSIDAVEVSGSIRAEVLVVDNGSSDGTAGLLAAGPVRRLPFRWIRFEPRGKCRAMNAAIAQSSGKVLLWTDDDVRVCRDWVRLMSEPILEGRADAVQGSVLIPDHLRARFRGTPMESRLSIFGSTELVDFSRPDTMWGPNMSFGRHVLSRVPGFDEALGPGQIGYGDETLFGFQLLSAGFRLLGVPESTVEHHFDASRVSKESMEAIASRIGASQAYIAFHWKRQREAMVPLQAAKAAFVYALRRAAITLSGGGSRKLDELRFLQIEWQSYLRQFSKMQAETLDDAKRR